MIKKEYKIIIFSAFIGIIFTALYDLIKSKPVLSTFLDLFKWLWNNVFEFELTIWQILLGLGVLVFILYLFSKKDNGLVKNKDSWLNYTKDKIHNMTWTWSWTNNTSSGEWHVKDLGPLCNSCGTKLQLTKSIYNRKFADCPRCNIEYFDSKDLKKIEAVIIDNIHRDIYPKENPSNPQ